MTVGGSGLPPVQGTLSGVDKGFDIGCVKFEDSLVHGEKYSPVCTFLGVSPTLGIVLPGCLIPCGLETHIRHSKVLFDDGEERRVSFVDGKKEVAGDVHRSAPDWGGSARISRLAAPCSNAANEVPTGTFRTCSLSAA